MPNAASAPEPITGFHLSITITTDDIPDLLAYGRMLRDAEDGGSREIVTLEQAANEVAWLFAAQGTATLLDRGGVYAEIHNVACAAVGLAAQTVSSGEDRQNG